MDRLEKTVLVVDDVADNIMLLKSILDAEGYKVKVANNGARCIDIANKHPRPDLILLDIMMPNMSGYEVCKHLKNSNETKDIPIIFVTAKNEIEDEALGFELGAVDYINKPISEAIVLARVKTQLQLKDLIDNLNEKVKKETELRVNQEKVLMQRSKAAAMGDMIDAIAHQWKTPLSVMSMNLQLLELDLDNKDSLKEKVERCIKKSAGQIKHLDETISNFRSFFRPSDAKEFFYIDQTILKAIDLINDEIIQNNIEIKYDLKEKISLIGNSNEFKHILVNLMSNSKDAFIQNNIKNREINIKLLNNELEDSILLEVIDNAGGIDENIIEDIFNPNFTTKEEVGGTGVGLYLCSQIAEKFGASLSVENFEQGAKFIFKKEIKK